MPKLNQFQQAYIAAALWSSTDDAGEPLDKHYGATDIDPDTLSRIIEDCDDFQAAQWEYIRHDLEQAGHDFWLTRNGHGAGFWDGDWLEHGDMLTREAKVYGGVDLFVVNGQVTDGH